MYKIVKRYNYTETQKELIRLDRERKYWSAIEPKGILERLQKWLILKGIHWQIKGMMLKIKGSYEKDN